MEEKLKSFEKLLNIMDELREKCPWDREQTFESIRNLTIEETYELADAIIKENKTEIRKELGDLLLHIVFYAKIGSETNDFDIKDVIDGLCDKLIFRHPHVFGNVDVNGSSETVKENWEELKQKEGNKSVLSGVPSGLPALVKANRVQEKVRAVGFDWDFKEQIWDKVNEELNELKVEIDANDQEKTEKEFGDLLFSVVNAARLYGVDPETALERTNLKFIKRFEYLEKNTIKKGKSLRQMNLDEMNEIWEEAKKYD
ncbi:MAG: nucleoside triphosphate pyrophosphohydrolase [Bacteroidales bacterium]|nr:nucleoside triphosphate pyrophosphohydrolase [Bacteroidales bacterium]MBN2819677.1 nucleoside triphosphate pyrophosphohydrolase [Bacteroidales bacterium]